MGLVSHHLGNSADRFDLIYCTAAAPAICRDASRSQGCRPVGGQDGMAGPDSGQGIVRAALGLGGASRKNNITNL
jgi:hypothetical protein